MGFLPFVQKYLIEMKKTMERNSLLEKYQACESLTLDEMKFLANTSELLNSCIDKKFMQNAVNIIEPDIVVHLELGLAEDILKKYNDI